MNVDYSSQTLTLFEGLSAQKGRLFNALFFFSLKVLKTILYSAADTRL